MRTIVSLLVWYLSIFNLMSIEDHCLKEFPVLDVALVTLVMRMESHICVYKYTSNRSCTHRAM